MTNPKRKNGDEEAEKQFFCLRCYNVVGRWNSFAGSIKTSTGRQNSAKFVCRGLTRHLTSGEQSCGKYYEAQGLFRNKKFDFSTSIARENEPLSVRRKYTPAEYGLTGNTRVSTKPFEEQTTTLSSQQVVHKLLQPHISREAIVAHENMLERSGSVTGIDDTGEPPSEFTTTIDEENDGGRNGLEESLNETEIKKRTTADFPATPRMKAEIELLQLIKQHKMPLKAFASIWDWAVRSQKIHGYNFEKSGGARSRTAILDQICQNLRIQHMNTFRPRIVPWLPDNNPREIYICEFQDALFSLLSCGDLMKEENLSLPNSKKPTSPEHDPMLTDDTEIQELHHGSWWCKTWKEQCQSNSNEIMVPIILYMDGISLDVRGHWEYSI